MKMQIVFCALRHLAGGSVGQNLVDPVDERQTKQEAEGECRS